MNAASTATDQTFAMASLEVFFLLAAAFVVGALFYFLLRLLRLINHSPAAETATEQQTVAYADDSQDQPEDRPVFTPAMPKRKSTEPAPVPPSPAITAKTERTTAAATADVRSADSPVGLSKTLGDTDIAYEADINSLIRSNTGHDKGVTVDLSRTEDSSVKTAMPSFESRVQQSLENMRGGQDLAADYALDMPDENHVDDLKKLEGIGPRIEKILNLAGVKSYARLATMDRDHIKAILEQGGSEFKTHDPKSWPYQAELAAKNNWERLREYQDFLLDDRN